MRCRVEASGYVTSPGPLEGWRLWSATWTVNHVPSTDNSKSPAHQGWELEAGGVVCVRRTDHGRRLGSPSLALLDSTPCLSLLCWPRLLP